MAIPNLRETIRPLQAPAYTFLIVTLLLQVGDLLLAAAPIRPLALIWRYQFLAQAASSIGNVMLVLILLHLLSLLLDDRRTLITLVVAYGVLMVLLLLCAVAFGLDAIQLRRRVDPLALSRFELSAAVAAGKFLVEATISLFLALSAWKSFKVLRKEILRGDRPSEDYLVVRGPAREH